MTENSRDTLKEQIYRDWISGFDQEFKVEQEIKSGYLEPLREYTMMGKINSINDFWNFYLKVKRESGFIKLPPLTPFQLVKARTFFSSYYGDASIHWFFTQAIEAIEHELYIPATSVLLNGIEASLRVTIHQLKNHPDFSDLSPYQVLSNCLISKAKEFGLPVKLLAFQDESDFEDKLISEKPNRIDVDIVKIRNNICHGNIFEYVEKVPETGEPILSPECLKNVTLDLVNMSRSWTYSLGLFRIEKGLHNLLSDRESDHELL